MSVFSLNKTSLKQNIYTHAYGKILTSYLLCKHSNGERASPATKLTIGSLNAGIMEYDEGGNNCFHWNFH